MRGDILGLERRRRWGDEEKFEIVLSVGVGGATVTQVAQRQEVTRQQIYVWQHELKRKGLLSRLPRRLLTVRRAAVPGSRTACRASGGSWPPAVAALIAVTGTEPGQVQHHLGTSRCRREGLSTPSLLSANQHRDLLAWIRANAAENALLLD